jgi:hypothetical protein
MASSPSPGTAYQYVLVVAHGDTVTLEDANQIARRWPRDLLAKRPPLSLAVGIARRQRWLAAGRRIEAQTV